MEDELQGIRMILVQDLVDVIKGRLIDKLVKKQDKCYNSSPGKCPDCNSKKVVGVEIMGARNGVLLWECDNCDEMFLKYEVEETELQLQNAKDCWTNSNDWGYVPRSKFN
jgi:transcription elongation factor Elf1